MTETMFHSFSAIPVCLFMHVYPMLRNLFSFPEFSMGDQKTTKNGLTRHRLIRPPVSVTCCNDALLLDVYPAGS